MAPPLESPITVLVMLLKAAGFAWYGVEKALPNGQTGTSCYLNTVTLHGDGTQSRRVVWSFIGGDEARVELGMCQKALNAQSLQGSCDLQSHELVLSRVADETGHGTLGV